MVLRGETGYFNNDAGIGFLLYLENSITMLFNQIKVFIDTCARTVIRFFFAPLLPNGQYSDAFNRVTYRPDIDGLRAIAVLAVIGFHAFPNWVHGGFVGVDIFFVLSGFLITGILLNQLQALPAMGWHNFMGFITHFYARRIVRIFPALLVVLVACYAFGWFSLFANEYKQLGKHIAAGAGFVANWALWGEAGYFDNAAETKPLLHLWSLGVEEQFYLLWPLALWVLWKRQLDVLTATLLLAWISYAVMRNRMSVDAVGVFFSPQTRLWELLAGAALAYVQVMKPFAVMRQRIKHKWDALGGQDRTGQDRTGQDRTGQDNYILAAYASHRSSPKSTTGLRMAGLGLSAGSCACTHSRLLAHLVQKRGGNLWRSPHCLGSIQTHKRQALA